MPKYPLLVKAVDTQPFWNDINVATSGDALDVVDSMMLSGVVIEDVNRIIKVNGQNITSIEIYLPE
jgi:hypothetical protein